MQETPTAPATGPYNSDDIATRYGFGRSLASGQLQAELGQKIELHNNYVNLTNRARLMKRALFNASKRNDKKQTAGQLTFATSGIYGFLVPLFTLQFEPFISALLTNIVSFTAVTAGAFAFAVAMIYQQKDFAHQARRFHEAGRRMNKLYKRMAAGHATNQNALLAHLEEYDAVLATCENHEDIDYQLAELGPRPDGTEAGELDRWIAEKRRLDIRLFLHNYTILALVWIAPPALGLLIWMNLAK